MSQEFEEVSQSRHTRVANGRMQTCTTSPVNREMQIKYSEPSSSYPTEGATIRENQIRRNNCRQGCWEKGKSPCTMFIFIYLWRHWVFVAGYGLSLVATGGLSRCKYTGSRAHRLSNCGPQEAHCPQNLKSPQTRSELVSTTLAKQALNHWTTTHHTTPLFILIWM